MYYIMTRCAPRLYRSCDEILQFAILLYTPRRSAVGFERFTKNINVYLYKQNFNNSFHGIPNEILNLTSCRTITCRGFHYKNVSSG